MSARRSHCGKSVEEKDLPRMAGARVLCLRCQQPMAMPAMTMPFSREEALPTVFASRESRGALSPDKEIRAGRDEWKGARQGFRSTRRA